MPCRLPFRAFYRGSLVILWKLTVFGLNVTFYVLMWYLGVLKCVKLVTEQESKSRRNILISEYFVQDDNFSADRRGGLSVQNRKYRSRLQHEQNIFSKYMYNVFDGVLCDDLNVRNCEMLCDYLCDCLKCYVTLFVIVWECYVLFLWICDYVTWYMSTEFSELCSVYMHAWLLPLPCITGQSIHVWISLSFRSQQEYTWV